MKLLKLESGSRSGVNAGKRNSVSRARCKRQSKDLIEWMKETAMAVENRSKNAGKKRPISERRTRLQRQGMAVLCHAPQKDRVEGTSRYRAAAADAVTGL